MPKQRQIFSQTFRPEFEAEPAAAEAEPQEASAEEVEIKVRPGAGHWLAPLIQ